MYKLNAWCIRAGVDKAKAATALFAAIKALGYSTPNGTVVDVTVGGQTWRVGFGQQYAQGQIYWAVPLPFDGWHDEYKTIPPMTADIPFKEAQEHADKAQ